MSLEREIPKRKHSAFKHRLRRFIHTTAASFTLALATVNSVGAPAQNVDQDFCMFSYGPADVSPVLRQRMGETNDIEEGTKPVEGGIVYTAADDGINEEQYQNLLRANMDCVILSWYPDQRDKYINYYADFLSQHPDNNIEFTFEYEPQIEEDIDFNTKLKHIEHLSPLFDNPNFYRDEQGRVVFFVFGNALTGWYNDQSYEKDWIEIAKEFNARVILEDYPLNFLKPEYNDPNIGWIGYDSDPWDVRPNGIVTTKDTSRILHAYDKSAVDGDHKRLEFNEDRLGANIDEAIRRQRGIVALVSASEIPEKSAWTPEIIDIYAEHLPPNN